jgi:predicted enzyme related to lactoylglutathione lyase
VAGLRQLTFACEDPDRLASFWAAALGYEVQELPPEILAELLEHGLEPGSRAAAVDPDGAGPRLFFLRKHKTPTTEIPIHFDLKADDGDAEVERLVALGATVVERKSETFGQFSSSWVVMQDPEGNGFCVG